MKNSEFPQIVIFDLYGTLVKFGVMHHPFRQLMKWARENGRNVKEDNARRLMTFNGDILTLADHLGIKAPQEILFQLQR